MSRITVALLFFILILLSYSGIKNHFIAIYSPGHSIEEIKPKNKNISPKLPEIQRYNSAVEENLCTPNNKEFNKPVVSLNFDDGWREIYENAIPILNKAGMRSTQFITTAVLRKNNETSNYMRAEDVLDMERMGHEIASHAIDHKRFTEMTEDEINAQINNSKVELLAMGVKSVDTFGTPYGEYTDYSVVAGKENYSAERTAISGMNDRRTNKRLLYGYILENWMVFSPYLKRLVDRANDENRWLILIFHQVASPDYRYYTSPEDLIKLTNYLVEKKIPVMPIRDVVSQCYQK